MHPKVNKNKVVGRGIVAILGAALALTMIGTADAAPARSSAAPPVSDDVSALQAADVPGPLPTVEPACFGATCNGKDPHAYACDTNAVTLDEFSIWMGDGYTRIQLRKSAWCGAAWARYLYASYPGYGTIQLKWYSCQAANSSCFVGMYEKPFNGNNWTKMGGYAYWKRACLKEHFGPCTDPFR